ncbi:MAG: MerR family transcriptional regulator [Rhodoblastus sp.]
MERATETAQQQVFSGSDGSAGLRAAQAAGDRLYTIGDMARAYRVTLRALRFYEDRGLIKPIRHGASRFYDAAARSRFETILRGKQLGFTLTQIFAMLPTDANPEATGALTLEEGQVLTQIAQLEKKREDLETALAALRETHSRMSGGDGAANANAA